MKPKKDLDSWGEVFIIDPITTPLAALFAKNKKIRPIYITLVAFLFGLASIILFLKGNNIFAAVSLLICTILDGTDGKVARANNDQIYIHGVMDQFLDQITIFLAFVAIIISASNFYITLSVLFLIGIIYIFEVSYALRQELKLRDTQKTSKINIKESYTNYLELLPKNAIIRIITKLHDITFKYRTFPYPKTSDMRFLLIFYFFFPHYIWIILMILFVLPDFLISMLLTFVHVRKLERSKNAN